ncbi:hypothetical protein Daesc_002409 [Daldinia eschscholtzii]|uniref:Uncharacterized protein n=1 Tax=Daldinia eschscholtzii TaxID=292717 RepID=A0AAX6MX95_9PEZI
MGYTPPGGNDSAVFYEPDKLPPGGTATTSNIAGRITSPVSGATYSWTYKEIEHIVTVASADSQPTNAASTNEEEGGNEGGNEGDNKGGDTSGDASGGGAGTEDKKNMAPSDMPRLLPTVCGLSLLLITIL